jgi:hypothetical protein
MNKSAHIFFGTTLGVILILVTHYFFDWFKFDLYNIGLMVVIIYIYSLIEDLDLKNSAVTWTFIPIGIIAIIIGYSMTNNLFIIGGISLLTITFLVAQYMPHRGFTHSIIFGLAVSLPWIYVSWQYSVLAFVCFYSHLLGDKEPLKLW